MRCRTRQRRLVLTADTSVVLVSAFDTMARQPIPDLLPGTLDLLILRTLQTDAHARLGDLGAHPADLPGRPAGQPGLALPGAPPPRAPGLDRSRVGRLGAGPAGEVLPTHAIRTPATGGRSRRVGTHVHGHRPRDEAGMTHESSRSDPAHSRAGRSAPGRTRARRGARVSHRARDTEAHRARRESRRRLAPGRGRASARCRSPPTSAATPAAPPSSTTWRATSSTRSARSAARRSPRSPSSRPSALGLGLITVVFTVYNAMFLRVDAVRNPGELFAVTRPRRPDARMLVDLHAAAIRGAAPRDQRLH